MIGLYRAELRRFARWAVGLGVLHAAALLLLDRSFPALRDDGEVAVVAGFVYAVAGAAFGLYQCASYARMGHWIALLHRPLAPWRIMAAVCGASATVLAAAVAVPLLVFTGALALQADRVVDMRHWQLAPAAALIALIGLGAGSYLALAPRRYGWSILVAPAVLTITSAGTGAGAMLLPLIIVAVLALLVAGAFQPDRSRPPSQPGLRSLTAGVVAVSLYFLLVGASGLACQLGLNVAGRNPEVDVPPPGGPVAASRATSADLFAAALAQAPGPEATTALARLRRGEARRLPVAFSRLPARGELTNTGPIGFTDMRQGIRWTYSHDANAFLGLRLRDRRPAGELRPAGGFDAPPLLLGEGRMIAGGSLYRLDPEAGQLEQTLQLPAGGTIMAAPLSDGRRMYVLGDRALYLVDDGAPGAGAGRAMLAVPLHGAAGDLLRLDVADLSDRLLLSFVFGQDSIDGPRRAWQHLMSVAPVGTVRTLAERPLPPDYPDLMRFRAYWGSPAIQALVAAAKEVGSSTARSPPRAAVEVPREVWIAAALLSLLAAVGTWVLGVRRGLRPGKTAAWAFAALALGVPMLAAFCLVRVRA